MLLISVCNLAREEYGSRKGMWYAVPLGVKYLVWFILPSMPVYGAVRVQGKAWTREVGAFVCGPTYRLYRR